MRVLKYDFQNLCTFKICYFYWAAVHTALYFIEQLIVGYNVDPKITNYVNSLNFYFVPVANPDGFEFSRSDINPQTRFWRKNRGPQVCKKGSLYAFVKNGF